MDRVTKISDTKQEFLGLTYWKCGEYFQRYGKRLHRAVWQHTHQKEIPEGFHVHHVDHDKTNNDPDNLDLIDGREHMSHHQKGHGRPLSQKALLAAAEWHKSRRGADWHKRHHEMHYDKFHQSFERECAQCGKIHQSKRAKTNAFCSNNCKSAFRRASKIDDVLLHCVCCGKEFSVNKYKIKEVCSRECAKEMRRRKKTE